MNSLNKNLIISSFILFSLFLTTDVFAKRNNNKKAKIEKVYTQTEINPEIKDSTIVLSLQNDIKPLLKNNKKEIAVLNLKLASYNSPINIFVKNDTGFYTQIKVVREVISPEKTVIKKTYDIENNKEQLIDIYGKVGTQIKHVSVYSIVDMDTAPIFLGKFKLNYIE